MGIPPAELWSWGEDQIDLLLASQALESEPKNSLGIPLTDAMDPKKQFGWVAPEVPTMDWSLKSAEDKRDAYYKKYPDVSRNGHMWRPPTLRGD